MLCTCSYGAIQKETNISVQTIRYVLMLNVNIVKIMVKYNNRHDHVTTQITNIYTRPQNSFLNSFLVVVNVNYRTRPP